MHQRVEILILDLIPFPHARHGDCLIYRPPHVSLKPLNRLGVVRVHDRLIEQGIALLCLEIEVPAGINKPARPRVCLSGIPVSATR